MSDFDFAEASSPRPRRPQGNQWPVILLCVAITAAVVFVGYMAFGPNAPRGAGTPARIVLGAQAKETPKVEQPKPIEKPAAAALGQRDAALIAELARLKELVRKEQIVRIARLRWEFARLNASQRERGITLGTKVKAGKLLEYEEYVEALPLPGMLELLLHKQLEIDPNTDPLDNLEKAIDRSRDRLLTPAKKP